MLFKIIFLIGLIKLLLATNKPFMCAGIYTALGFIFGLLIGQSFLNVLIASVVAFAFSALYFWLLDRFEYNILLWWVILMVGLLIGLV